QRSEGGGLGMGGGGGGGLVSVRGSASLLTRTTGILAALFFATSIGMTVISQVDRASDSILDQVEQGANNSVLDALNALQPDGATSGAGAPAPDQPADPASSLPVPGVQSPAEPATPALPTQ
ncbi:MAG: preprotein translocase subunit SecG, partial [Alphaproteobacteria bacterium]|nr:preprotein translocase subunit SecG [Alphaproteobacteria bacterium]